MEATYYVLFKRGDYWNYYFYRWGKRVRRSTGCKRKSEAIIVANDRLMRGDLANEGKSIHPKTFAEYAEPFFVWETCPIVRDKIERGGHYSEELAYINRKQLEKYLLPVFGKKVLPEITPAMVSSFLRNLPKKWGISPQTANKVLSVLRQILDFSISENLLSENPCSKVKPLVPKESERGCFTTDQIKTLFSHRWKDPYVEIACRLASITGMRLGEIRGLLKKNVRSSSILVEHSYSNREGLKTTKNGKSRVVPIPPEIAEELKSLPNNGEFVFSYDGVSPIHSDTISDKLKEHMRECKIDYKKLGLSFHSFRHYLNTQLVANGVDQNEILAVVGHSSIKMTQHYLHLEANDLTQIRKVQEAI